MLTPKRVRLSPAERCVFVLHDIFRLPFDEIAQTVGRTVVSCRQLARRARQKIASGQDGVRFDVASAEHRRSKTYRPRHPGDRSTKCSGSKDL